jgi:adenylate cyclase
MTNFSDISADPLYLQALASLGSNVSKKQQAAREKGSIAVLPFLNVSGDSEQEFFTDGLTEDIITDLSNVKGFFVIARNSTFVYKGKPTDVRQIAQDLGVKYILQGSARKADQRLRINVLLIDAEAGGNHVWAERFDRDLSDIFAIQDEVTTRVIEAIVGTLSSRSEKQRPSNLEAYDLCVRARHLWSHSAAACDESRILLERAIELDPNYAEAHWRYAFAVQSSCMFYGANFITSQAKTLALVTRALQLDPNDSSAQYIMAKTLISARRWDEADVFIDKSLTLNPNEADVLALLGDGYSMLGKPQEALLATTKALRLNPQPPGWYYWLHGFAQFNNGQYEEAVKTFRRPETYRTESRRNLAAALAKLNRLGQAQEEANFFMLANPNWRISTWMENQPFKNPQDAEFWAESYRLAELPE